MIDLYKRPKFELRPPMERRDKTREECLKFWLDIKARLRNGDPVTGDRTKFSFSAGYPTIESKITYCNDMIFLITHNARRPKTKREKVKQTK